jgi:hypothetical protein
LDTRLLLSVYKTRFRQNHLLVRAEQVVRHQPITLSGLENWKKSGTWRIRQTLPRIDFYVGGGFMEIWCNDTAKGDPTCITWVASARRSRTFRQSVKR